MKRDKIINSLKDSDEPLKLEDLSKKTDIPKSRLRTNLYRLREEGTIQSVQKEGKLMWTKKTKNPKEEKYEDISETPK